MDIHIHLIEITDKTKNVVITTKLPKMQSLQRILSLQLANAAREVLGKCLCAKKPWISQATLASIDQCRQAIRKGDVEEYRRLAGPQRRSLRHDKQQWMEQVARTGENHLLFGEIKDAFASFRQLKQKCATSSAPLKTLDGKL